MRKQRCIALMQVGGAQWIGGATYIHNLAMAIDHYRKHSGHAIKLVLLQQQNTAPSPPFDAVTCYPCRTQLRLATKLKAWTTDQWYGGASVVHRWLQTQRFDLVYPHFYGSQQPGNVRSAAWIPDFQHRFLPDFFRYKDRWARDLAFWRMAHGQQPLVLSSQAAHRDYQALFPTARITPTVMPFCTPLQPQWTGPQATALWHHTQRLPRFFLVSNQFWRHKNHTLVWQAAAKLRRRGCPVQVLCTGRWQDAGDSGYTMALKQQIVDLDIERDIHFLGLIPRDQQIQLMRHCIAVIQPSLFEGWSTVVEDARALGKPILLSDLVVHREQAPEHAHYFDPNHPTALAELMRTAWDHWPGRPTTDMEARARRDNEVRVKDYGQRFMSLLEAWP